MLEFFGAIFGAVFGEAARLAITNMFNPLLRVSTDIARVEEDDASFFRVVLEVYNASQYPVTLLRLDDRTSFGLTFYDTKIAEWDNDPRSGAVILGFKNVIDTSRPFVRTLPMDTEISPGKAAEIEFYFCPKSKRDYRFTALLSYRVKSETQVDRTIKLAWDFPKN